MALQSDVKSCLMWKTERPYVGRPRRSSCFGLLGKEWYLEMSVDHKYYCRVHLHRRNGNTSKLQTPIYTSCHVIGPDLTLQDRKNGFDSQHTVERISDPLFEGFVPDDKYPAKYHSDNWIVFCRLSCGYPLTIQMNNDETILLSTVKVQPLPKVTVDKGVQVTPEVPRDVEALSSDFTRLYVDEIFPDFELKCGGRSFPVHRSVLAARSEVFRAMLESKMLESETGSADIRDLQAHVLESLVKFVYSGKLEQVSEDTAISIYVAADKYAVHCLKTACSQWMKGNMSEENCVAFLDIADSHVDHDLRVAVASFIVQHPGVLKSATWMAYSDTHHEMAKEVLQMYASSTIQ